MLQQTIPLSPSVMEQHPHMEVPWRQAKASPDSSVHWKHLADPEVFNHKQIVSPCTCMKSSQSSNPQRQQQQAVFRLMTWQRQT